MKKKQFWRISYCFAAWEAALKWQMTRKKESFWRSSNPSRKLLPNWFSEICSAFIYAFRELSLLLDCVIFSEKKKSPFAVTRNFKNILQIQLRNNSRNGRRRRKMPQSRDCRHFEPQKLLHQSLFMHSSIHSARRITYLFKK